MSSLDHGQLFHRYEGADQTEVVGSRFATAADQKLRTYFLTTRQAAEIGTGSGRFRSALKTVDGTCKRPSPSASGGRCAGTRVEIENLFWRGHRFSSNSRFYARRFANFDAERGC